MNKINKASLEQIKEIRKEMKKCNNCFNLGYDCGLFRFIQERLRGCPKCKKNAIKLKEVI